MREPCAKPLKQARDQAAHVTRIAAKLSAIAATLLQMRAMEGPGRTPALPFVNRASHQIFKKLDET